MINAAKRIICASIPGFVFECVRKHISYAHDNKRVFIYHALTSRFSRWDKVSLFKYSRFFIGPKLDPWRAYLQNNLRPYYMFLIQICNNVNFYLGNIIVWFYFFSQFNFIKEYLYWLLWYEIKWKPTNYKIKSVHWFYRKENEKHVIWT